MHTFTTMSNNKIGYIRVSTEDQNTDRQLAGIELEHVFTDKASGENLNRPQFQEMMKFIRKGDTLYIHSVDRFARSFIDLLKTIEDLRKKDVKIIFVTERLEFTKNSTDPASALMLHMIGAMAQFERQLIRNRQREGIEAAKKKGVYKGRKPALNDEQIKVLNKKYAEGTTVAGLTREFDVSRNTVYKYLK